MAGITVCDAVFGIRELDVMLIVQGLHRIIEINIANIEVLAGMDGVDIGIDRSGLFM